MSLCRNLVLALIVGFGITCLTSWLAVWHSVHQYNRKSISYANSGARIFAFAPGEADSRWLVQLDEYPWNVHVLRMSNYSDDWRYVVGIDGRERQGPEVLPTWSRAHEPPNQGTSPNNIFETAAGWPFIALKGEWHTIDDSAYGSESVWSMVFINKHDLLSPTVLPLKPIFPGIILNAIIWGAVVWACWFLLRARIIGTIRWRRTRRALCPSCGYDLGLLPTCPECGHTSTESHPAP